MIHVERLTPISLKALREVVKAFRAAIGHPDMNLFLKEVAGAQIETELEKSSTGRRELRSCWHPEALRVARDLDSKTEALLTAAAAGGV